MGTGNVAGPPLESGQAVFECGVTHFDQYFAREPSIALRVLGSQERDGGRRGYQDRSAPGLGKSASVTDWLAAADRRRYAVSK